MTCIFFRFRIAWRVLDKLSSIAGDGDIAPLAPFLSERACARRRALTKAADKLRSIVEAGDKLSSIVAVLGRPRA